MREESFKVGITRKYNKISSIQLGENSPCTERSQVLVCYNKTDDRRSYHRCLSSTNTKERYIVDMSSNSHDTVSFGGSRSKKKSTLDFIKSVNRRDSLTDIRPEDCPSLTQKTLAVYTLQNERPSLDFTEILPYPVAMRIVEYIGFPGVLETMKVCKKWNAFVNSDVVWKKLFFHKKKWKTQKLALALERLNVENNRRADEYIEELVKRGSHELGSEQNLNVTAEKRVKGHNTIGHSNGILKRNHLNVISIINDLSNFKKQIHVKTRLNGQSAASMSSNRHEEILGCYGDKNILKKELSFTSEIKNYKRVLNRISLGRSMGYKSSKHKCTKHDDGKIEWRQMYKNYHCLESRWLKGIDKVYTYIGHEDSIYCLQFDKNRIVTGSRDRTIKEWNIETYECVRTLIGHTGSVLCLKYDPEILVTGSSDCTAVVWDWESGKMIHVLSGHFSGVLDVVFDQNKIISCSKDCTIKIWDRKTGENLKTIYGHEGPVNSLSLKNNILISASGDSTIKMWCVETGDFIKEFVGHTKGLACVQFDGKTIVSGSNDHTIKVWDAEKGICKHTLKGHTDLVRTLYFAGGNRAISGSYDQTVKVWDVEKGVLLLDFENVHTSWVFGVQFSMTKIVSVSQDQKVNVWNFDEGLDLKYLE